MKGIILIGIIFENYFEGVGIKRGTLFKEFLNIFFFLEFFFLAETVLPHEIKIVNLLQGRIHPKRDDLCFKVFSSETVSFFLPFFLRDASTRRPFAVAILSRKPCLFFLFLFEGWNVRFIALSVLPLKLKGCKYS